MNPSIPATGIRGPSRSPHRTSIVPTHAPITTFNPRARLLYSSLTGLVLLAFIAALHFFR
jgi:hypothetical protein